MAAGNSEAIPEKMSVWIYCLFSGLLTVLAFPPVGLWPLAFIAPCGWILLIQNAGPDKKIPYWKIWCFGILQWSAVFHFLRLPHFAGWFGIPAMGAYFSIYLLLFVIFCRSIHHRFRIPLIVLCPTVWCGLEVLRATFLTGFPIAMWGHTLYRQTLLIQIADIAGEITVSFFLISVAAVIAKIADEAWKIIRKQSVSHHSLIQSCGLMVLILGMVMGYGFWSDQTYSTFDLPKTSESKVLLLQGTRDVRFGLTQEQYEQEEKFHFAEHQDLIVSARKKHEDLDLVVWPESMFPYPDYLPEPETEIHKNLIENGIDSQYIGKMQGDFRLLALNASGFGSEFQNPVAQLVGCRSINPGSLATYNSAVLINGQNQIEERYYKTHLVPFGEYLPLGEWIPALYSLAPMESSLAVGPGAKPMRIKERKILPVICFESMMGNFIREYFLSSNNESVDDDVDAMITLTNDGWYYGSSALDLHLAANVFRAVENRTPHLVAANTGLSAEISPTGRILQSVPRRVAGSILCSISKRDSSWRPIWWSVGNLPWFVMAVLSTILYFTSRFFPKKSI